MLIPKRKLRVSLIHDKHGWAYHKSCVDIAKYLVDCDTTIHGSHSYSPGSDDVALIFPRHSLPQMKYDPQRTITSIMSFGGFSKLTDVKVRSVFCANKQIYEQVVKSNAFSEVIHVPESVDVDSFQLNNRPPEFVVGWAGNDGRRGKNFDTVLKVQELSGLPFKFALGSDPVENMQAFYDSISILLVCGDSEGGPRVSIEAGACGVPTIYTCTRSAVHETIINNYDGFQCEYSVDAIVKRLLELREEYDLVTQAGVRFRKTVEAKHDFKLNAVTIQRMLLRASQ